jgi:hypothetical protein
MTHAYFDGAWHDVVLVSVDEEENFTLRVDGEIITLSADRLEAYW